MAKILVDADACPVVGIAENMAKEYGIPIVLFCDTNHIMTSDYGEVRVIGAGTDAVDFALLKECKAGDIVVTQDYGLAGMALSQRAFVLNQDGWEYTDKNIDELLQTRYLSQVVKLHVRKRKRSGYKRSKKDNQKFGNALGRLLTRAF